MGGHAPQIAAVSDHHLEGHSPTDLLDRISQQLLVVDNTRDLLILGPELALLGTRNETVRYSLTSIQDRTLEALVASASGEAPS